MKNKFNLKITFLASTLLFSFTNFAQKNSDNLVENGSFESVSGKLRRLGGITSATGWLTPTAQPADLYASSSKVPEIGIPNNANGKEDAYDGRNYAGIVAYSYNDKVPRSYAMAKLTQPLKKGQKYCVSFYASLSENSKYATNSIGANLTKKPYTAATKVSIIDEMDVRRSDKKVLNGFYGWDKVCNIFIAKGGEKYITVGNFLNNNEVGYEKMRTPKYYKGKQEVAAYYYIDDVSVKMIDNLDECDCSVINEDEKVSTLVFQKIIEVTPKMDAKQILEAQTAFFAFGSAELTSAGKEALKEVASRMNSNQSFRLEIQGHTDAIEDDRAEANPAFEGLDVARAEAAKEYLVKEANVFGSRITVSGKGNTVLNDDDISEADDDELQQAKSRRVTFVVQ